MSYRHVGPPLILARSSDDPLNVHLLGLHFLTLLIREKLILVVIFTSRDIL